MATLKPSYPVLVLSLRAQGPHFGSGQDYSGTTFRWLVRVSSDWVILNNWLLSWVDRIQLPKPVEGKFNGEKEAMISELEGNEDSGPTVNRRDSSIVL